MRLVFSAALCCIILLASPAIALPDNIYITVPNGSSRYITVQLPDDSGWAGMGEVEYTVAMMPEPLRTWSDFSEQIVRTDENNTVQIPIYFTRKSNASCGERFTLTISAPSVGTSRTITGGACESSFGGVSTAPAASGQAVGSALNQNFGLFDLAFTEQSYYVQPGGIANITVLASSYQDGASLRITLASGSFAISPASHDVSFGAAGGQKQLQFQVQAPGLAAEAAGNSAGTYDLVLSGSIPGCSAQACSMTKRASIVVGGSQPTKGGFSAQLFPASINTQQGRPVTFRLTVYNNEATRSFNISMLQAYGIETNLGETILIVGGGSQQSIGFNVTPTGAESSYELGIYVKSAENTKLVTGYLNVNGMEAGAQRGLEMVQATGNQSAMNQAGQAYGSFQSSPSLDSYGSLQDELDRLEKLAQAPAPSFQPSNAGNNSQPVAPVQNYTPAQASQGQGIDIFGSDVWILVAVVGIAFAASVVFYMRNGRGGKGKGLKQEFKYRENLQPV